MRKLFGMVAITVAAVCFIGVALPASASAPEIGFYPSVGYSKRWIDTASSSDGVVGYAALNTTVGYGDKISKTTNGGRTFRTLDSSPAGSYIAIDTSSDGEIVFAVYTDSTDYILTRSLDAGATWEFVIGNNVNAMRDIAVSDNGQKVVLSFGSLAPMISLDGGDTWGAGGAPPSSLERVDISGNGSKIVATGGIYALVSTDDGVSWTQVAVTTSSPGSAVNASYDGSVVMVTSQQGPDGDVYVSTDGGATFSSAGRASIYNGGNQGAYQTLSNDGQTMLWAFYGSPLYMSRDAGATWDEVAPGAGWLSFAISEDGLSGYALTEGDHWRILAPIPQITGVTPATVLLGKTSEIVVHGQYFASSCGVYHGTELLTTTYVSPTKMKANVEPTVIGEADIQVMCDMVGYESSVFTDAYLVVAPPTTADTLPPTGSRSSGAAGMALLMVLLGGGLVVLYSRVRIAQSSR